MLSCLVTTAAWFLLLHERLSSIRDEEIWFTCRHRSRSGLFGASSACSDPAAAQVDACGPRRVGLGSTLVSRTPAEYIDL